jgi:hypothetical protein
MDFGKPLIRAAEYGGGTVAGRTHADLNGGLPDA